ncbi:FAD-binding protein [Amycolatopsis sp. NPDC051071]|uniref:FAD-dependent oxidoreductase n=1 Tax=Amycolatopsis sp. NPDC051071 TaxID=3154637 RepID=UPI00341D054E
MSVPKIDRDDVRYPDLVQGNNLRWVGTPDKVYLPRDAAEVAACVRKLTGKGQHFTVRSGGHCYEDHVFNSSVRAVVDLGLLRVVEHDQETGCVAVGPGQSLWEVYLRLHRRWGTTIPGGECATVGAGGHIVGGGYGLLSRRDGLTVDYLHGVEVVTADGEIRLVTRDSTGADHDLWWAHTGGGGGNFGVITRYLLRDPAAGDRTPPHELLPRAPRQVLLHELTIGWDQVGSDGAELATMLRRFSRWCEHHCAHDADADNQLFALFEVLPQLTSKAPAITLTTQVAIDDNTPDSLTRARATLKDFLGAVLTVGSAATHPRNLDRWAPRPWLNATQRLGQGSWKWRADYKSAYHRRLTDHQIDTLAATFAAAGQGAEGARVSLDTYGGKVNAVDKGATATPHRDSAIKLQYMTFWTEPAQDDDHVQWLRDTYTAIYAETGGVPAAANDDPDGTATDGCFVNYLDADLPAQPTTDVASWWQLYYGDTTFTKLVRTKHAIDPDNVFHHAQSIPPTPPRPKERGLI